ncbi:NAD(P)H-binding protein [Enterococcus ratti]|uniref:NAD dependent epimerase/dehydratase n=1 Tax=Enterococcus ratti TaxID=150033 RepID=A0A1L8WFI3_9ENTE|nr:NAD(P)H-binding protein [Enterococcus ratti]OJG79805.1 NAD dependent epimerase/dehydratase [Enterococcus ratti]
MKIFVVGANGQIGRHLIKDLAANYQVVAGVREVATQSLVKKENVSYVPFNLTWSVEEMVHAFNGNDLVIFTAGSRGKNLLQVDLDGAVKTMIAAEKANISRYFMVSAFLADTPSKWPENMLDYYIAKHYADEWLKHHTSLDYVIVQAVSLTNDEEVTSVQLAKPSEKIADTVSRKTVASVLTALVDQPKISKTTFVLSKGTQPLSSAFHQFMEEE